MDDRTMSWLKGTKIAPPFVNARLTSYMTAPLYKGLDLSLHEPMFRSLEGSFEMVMFRAMKRGW